MPKLRQNHPELGHFETENEFVDPLAESIRPFLNENTHLLFSYHGLPISHVKRIDAYEQWSMSYQSRLGPVKWLEPATTSKVEELVNRGIKNIVVVAPAFLADGLETLEELDIELREDFLEMGGEELTVVKCLNDDDQWIDGLESLVRKRLDPITA